MKTTISTMMYPFTKSLIVPIRKMFSLASVAGISLMLVAAAGCDSDDNGNQPQTIEQQSALYKFEDGSPLPGGGATLKRTPTDITMTIDAQDLWPTETYTIWWVIFNEPNNCQHGMSGMTGCGEEDLFEEPVGGSVLFADGNISDNNGRAQFSATLSRNDISGCQPPFDEFGICRDGLHNPMDGEVHLVIRSHGEVIPDLLYEQLNTFSGGCTPESSFDIGNGPNECIDSQFAVFMP